MKSLHVVPEIPLVLIYDRAKHTTEAFEVNLQALHALYLNLRDALEQHLPEELKDG
jgi:hypothetical protein